MVSQNVIGNWTFAGAFTAETGELGTGAERFDANLNGDTAGDRVVINSSGDPNLGSNSTALKTPAGAIVAYRASNPECEVCARPGWCFPNAGRNILQFLGINPLIYRSARISNISEHKKILNPRRRYERV